MQEQRQHDKTAVADMPASVSRDDGYYPIRMDVRGSHLGETLYDIAEKLLGSELQSAQQALERLWALRKETQSDENAGVVDSLIAHYESRVSTLRGRDERVRKVSRDSRDLLERRRGSEKRLHEIREQIAQCRRAIEEIEEKHRKLQTEELTLAGSGQSILDTLQANEREVVEALRDIAEPAQLHAAAAARAPAARPPAPAPVERRATPTGSAAEEVRIAKSVVKTSRGRVLGEYCYDARVPKQQRHYVYHSGFLLQQLTLGLDMLRKDYDRENHAELLQMLQDVTARVEACDTLHMEIATHDIVNAGRLREAYRHLRNRSYDEVESFCGRLRSKLDTLGPNYRRLLKAQLDRLHGRRQP